MTSATPSAAAASSTFAEVISGGAAEPWPVPWLVFSGKITPPSCPMVTPAATLVARHGIKSVPAATGWSRRTSRRRESVSNPAFVFVVSLFVARFRFPDVPRASSSRVTARSSPSSNTASGSRFTTVRRSRFGGGLSKIPGTSVTNTARFGLSVSHSWRTNTSPERMEHPRCASSTTSPCITHTKPACIVFFRDSSAGCVLAKSRVLPPSFVHQLPNGETPTASTPASTSAPTTREFKRHTDARVFAMPLRRFRLNASSVPVRNVPFPPPATPNCFANWCPKLPAPCTTTTLGVPPPARVSAMYAAIVPATLRNAGSLRHSVALALCVMAAPPSFTTRSTFRQLCVGAGVPAFSPDDSAIAQHPNPNVPRYPPPPPRNAGLATRCEEWEANLLDR